MEYVELLRARRVLFWYGGILFALIAIGLALAFKDGPPVVQMSHGRNLQIPFEALVVGAAFGPLILAAFLGVGLDAEFKTAAITWTRPLARMTIALRYVAIDLGALIVAAIITFAAVMICITALGLLKFVTYGSNGIPPLGPAEYVLLGLGCAVMWYGLVVLVTMLLPGRGSAVAGGSWAYALIVPALAEIPFPPALHHVMVALNYVNPLAYIGSHGRNGGANHVVVGSSLQHAVAVWLIGIVAVAIATQLWVRREVPS